MFKLSYSYLFFASALLVSDVCSQESTTSSTGFFSKLNSIAQSIQTNSNGGGGGGSEILGTLGSLAQQYQNRNAASAPNQAPSSQSNAGPNTGANFLSSASSFLQSIQSNPGSTGGSGILGTIQSYAQSYQNKGSPASASNLPSQPVYPTQTPNNVDPFGSNAAPSQSLYPQLPPLPNNNSPTGPSNAQPPQNNASGGGVAEWLKTHGQEIVQKIATDPRVQQAISKAKQELDNVPQRAQTLYTEHVIKKN